MKRKLVFYFDSDGVIKKWRNVPVEDTFKDGHFLNLEDDLLVKEVMTKMIKKGYDVRILTKYYTETNAKEEKRLSYVNSGMGDVPVVFVPYKDDKFDYIDPSDCNVLVDDFTDNLFPWREHGGVAIKYYNGINGTRGRWNGYAVSNRMTPQEIVNLITGVAEKEYASA